MSKTVDQRVVEMEFDNKQFEKNVETSMSTLDKLKEKLNLNNAAKSFEELDKAANKVDMSGLGAAVETVQVKFSALETIAMTALANITNSAMNAGKQLISSLSIDQVSSGWDKYAQKTTSVATLVAQGYDQSVVDEQLARLNWFTDETSYDFTEMVSSISKFTATGQTLEESVSAMEGIANWAALSGQNATTASRAMYQLSQAMGAGLMRLEDYKSIQNVSMDTDEFRQKCLDAAVALGTLKKNSDGTYQSLVATSKAGKEAFSKSQFATNLTQGLWLTSDVMMEVFKQYGSAVDQIYEYAEEKSITASEAIEELEGSLDEFGLKAFRAAQEAKTFSDAIDATKDAVSTGWMNTFELIFGNYEQQRVLWTDLANELYDVFASSAEARNELLEGWNKLGGRDALIEAFSNTWKAIKSVVTPIKEAFREIFPPTTAEQLYTITERLRGFTEKLVLSAEASEKLKKVAKAVFSVLKKLKTMFVESAKMVKNWIDAFLKIPQVQTAIATISTAVQTAVSKSGEYLKLGSDKILEFIETLQNVDNISFDNIQQTWKNFTANLKNNTKATISELLPFNNIFSTLSSVSAQAEQNVSAALSGISSDVDSVCESIGQTAEKVTGYLSENIGFGEIATVGLGAGMIVIIRKVAASIKTLISPLEILTKIGNSANNLLTAATKALNTWSSQKAQNSRVILSVAIAIGVLAGSLYALSNCNQAHLWSAVGAMSVLMAVITGLYFAISKIGVVTNFGNSVKNLSLVLISFAASVWILADALEKVNGLDHTTLEDDAAALGAIIIAFGVAVAIISKYGAALQMGAFAILALAASVRIIVDGLKELSGLTFDTTAVNTMIGALGVLGLLAIACKNIGVGTGIAIVGAAIALNLVIAAFKQLETINTDKILDNIESLAGVFIAMVGLVFATQKVSGSAWQAGVAILGMATALILVCVAMKMLSGMDASGLRQAKNTVTQIFVVFALVAAASKTVGQHAWQAGVMLLMMSGALVIVAAAVVALSKVDNAGMDRALGIVTVLEILFAGLIAVTYFAKDCKATLLMIAVTIGILAISLGALAAIKAENLKAATFALSAVMVAFGVLILVSQYAADSVKAMGVIAVLGLIVGGIGAIFYLLKDVPAEQTLGVAASISLVLLSISASLWILQSVKGLTAHAIAGALGMTLVVAALAAIFGVFATLTEGTDMSSILPLAESISLLLIAMSASLWLLAGVGTVAPAALAGIGVLVAFIGSLTAFAVVFGDLVALGMEKLTNGLPAIATNLSKFAENLAPFLAAIQQITPDTATTLKTFISAISDLLGASFWSNISSKIFGEDDLSGWKTKLENFGDAINAFAEKTKGITYESIKGAIEAGSGIAKMAKELPNDGGVISWFTGNNNIGEFATGLSSYADALSAFYDNTNKIKYEDIEGSLKVAETLAQIGAALPNSGGVVSWFTGNNDMDDFGDQLQKFGEGINAYVNAVKDITEDQITAAQNTIPVAQSLADVTALLPNTGGAIGDIIGNNDPGYFGSQLEAFGQGIKAYAVAVNGIGLYSQSALDSVPVAEDVVGLCKLLPKSGGIIGDIFGSQDPADFGSQLGAFGEGIKAYSQAVDGIGTTNTMPLVNAITKLAENSDSIKEFDKMLSEISNMTTFKTNLGLFGDALRVYSLAVTGITGTEAINATNAVSEMVPMFDIIKSIDDLVGNNRLANFGNELSNLGVSLKTYCNTVADLNATGIENGNAVLDTVEALANFGDSIKTITDTITSQELLETFKSAGQTWMNQIVLGMDTNADLASSKAKTIASDVAAKFKTRWASAWQAGKYLVKGFAEGIRENANLAARAARAVAEAATDAFEDELDEHSPSKVGYRIGDYLGIGFANGIYDNVSSSYKAGTSIAASAKEGLQNAVSKINSLIESGIDTQPTIRPILDLSQAQAGASQLSALLSKNQAMSISTGMAASKEATEIQNGGTGATTGNTFTFTQNNYSPKALSRIEIYRQTKNQFSAMKGLVST
jgi:hypothetical protein